MQKKVIIISGKMRCGKNQLADYIEEILIEKNFKTNQDYFAKSLKNNCKEDFNSLATVLENIGEEIFSTVNIFFDTREHMINPSIMDNIRKSIDKLKIKSENWFDDKTDITRSILQIYGTEIFRRRVDENWWVKQVKDRCIDSDSDFIIITDCRFPNEITEMFDNENYEIILIKIERNINTNNQSSKHDSETALDNWKEWNYIINNNGTLEDLKNSASTIITDIIHGNDTNE